MLLKNAERILPLDRLPAGARIAVIGRPASQPAATLAAAGSGSGHVNAVAVDPLPKEIGLHPYRRLLDGGVELAGSSDYPVSGYDVLAAIRAAVTRRTELGELFGEGEAITVEEALRAYTVGGAHALGVEDQAGTVEVGSAQISRCSPPTRRGSIPSAWTSSR